MVSPDSDRTLDEQAGVVVRCQDNSSVGVRFCDRFGFDQDSVHYAVEAWAPALAARVSEVVAWTRDSARGAPAAWATMGHATG
ncbi:DUF6228 family protein [Streptomyces sp. NPDC019645]|uniref:DUF6228 family protein n=1 Tax=unclassified Streptomyces TaxID=2593676 RepID=UPI0033ECCAF8